MLPELRHQGTTDFSLGTAPRIHGELLKLGFDLSERSVSRWMRRAPRDSDVAKRWLTFLRNHREAIAAARQEWSRRGGRQGWGQARTPLASFYQAAYPEAERAIHWVSGFVPLSSRCRLAIPAARSWLRRRGL